MISGIWAITVLILSFAVLAWLVAALLVIRRDSLKIKRINDSLDRTVDNCIDFNKQVRLLNSQVKKRDDA
jgi:hypothetical protein